MTRSVYSFTGKRFSGKSTAAKVLVEMGFVDVKFADPLKNMLRALYATCGVDAETAERKIEGDLKEVSCEWLSGNTPRYAMQTLGTEWRNMLSETLWSDIFVKRIESGFFGDKIVCSDHRFPHETDALASVGARTFKIIRRGLEDDAVSEHVSETSIDLLPVEGVINNDGSEEDFREFVYDLVNLVEGITHFNSTVSPTPLEIVDAA